MPVLPGFLGAIFGGLGALSSRLGPDPYRWWQDFVQSGRDRAWLEAERARQAAYSIFDPLRESSLGDWDLSQQYNRALFSRYLQDALGENGILSPQSARDRLLQFLDYRPQGFNETLQGLQSIGAGLNEPREIAAQLLRTGGWSPQTQDLFDFWSREMAGAGAPNATLADVGLDLLGSRGQDQYSRGWLDIGTDAAARGGMTPGLQAGMSGALGLIGSQGWGPRESRLYDLGSRLAESNGMTPEVSGLYSMGMSLAGSRGMSPEIMKALGDIDKILASGGYSPENAELYRQAKDILTRREAEVMSPDEAAEKARLASHLEYSRRMEDAQRRAMARGGGAVVSGLQGRGLAEFADEAARAADEAALRASLSQQGLSSELARSGLSGALAANEDATRRLLTALGLEPDILKIAAQREATGYGAASDALGRATQYAGLGYGAMADAGRLAGAREGLGYSALANLQNAATSAMEPLLRLAMAGAQNELSRMQLGGGLLDQYNTARARAGTGFGSLLGNQQQYTLGAGRLLSDLEQLRQQGYLSAGDLALRGGQFGFNVGRGLNEDILRSNPYNLGSNWLESWQNRSGRTLLDLYGPMMSGAYGMYNSSTSPFMPGGIRPEGSLWGDIFSGAYKGYKGGG